MVNLTDDPGVKDALTFLLAREMAHQKSVGKALCSIEPNLPPGKLPGNSRFTDVYFRTFSGEPETADPGRRGSSGTSFR